MSDEQKTNQVAVLTFRPLLAGGEAPGRAVPQVFTSLDGANREHQRMAANALSSATYSAPDVADKPFQVEHILAHELMLADKKTGELTRCVRTVLFMPNGDSVGFVSQGVYGSVVNFIAVRGQPPWTPPLNVRLIKKKANPGELFLLELVD